MNANQVLIVMDRDGAETLTGKTGKHSSDCAGPGWDCDCGAANEGRARMRRGRAALRAALDRDPDEMEARIAEALAVEGWPEEGPVREGSNQHQFLSRLARAVLHALQEGTEK